MVQIINANALRDGGPEVHIHFIERSVHGNGIAIRVYGEMKIAAKEHVYARELKLNTLEVLLLTPFHGGPEPFFVQKWIYEKGEFDNYASVDIFSPDAYQMLSSGGVSVDHATELPEDGSIWLDFEAVGE